MQTDDIEEKASEKIEDWTAQINEIEAKMRFGRVENSTYVSEKIKELSYKIAHLKSHVAELTRIKALWSEVNSTIQREIKELDHEIKKVDNV